MVRHRDHLAGPAEGRRRPTEPAAPLDLRPGRRSTVSPDDLTFTSERGIDVTEELCYLPASEALALFRRRELSPVELMQATIDRDRGARPGRQRPADPLLRRGARGGAGGRGPLRGPRPGAAPARGPSRGRQGRGRGGRPALHRGLADPQGRRRRPHGGVHPADHRRRRHHPRALGDTGVLLRGDHRLAHLGASRATRGTSSTARAARRAAPAPRSPPAWRASPPAPTSAAPSASPRRSAAWSASSRPTAGCRRSRPSTSTTTATTGRWRARVEDCRLLENVMAGPHRDDIVSLRPKLTIPPDLPGVGGLEDRRERRPRRLRGDRGGPREPARRRPACSAPWGPTSKTSASRSTWTTCARRPGRTSPPSSAA